MSNRISKENQFVVDNRVVTVYPAATANRPVVNRECKTRNPYLKMVQEQTEAIHSFYTELGIDTEFRFNPGNHYQDAIRRTAAGIAWILER